MKTAAQVDGFYQKLPVPLQNVACSYYGWRDSRVRYGPEFHRRLAGLLDSDWWPDADIAAYQDDQVARLVRRAYDEVPYYRDVMKSLHLRPGDIKGRADLQKLPVLDKETVRRAGGRLRSSAVDPRTLLPRHTSGTTGKSLSFSVTRKSIGFQWAVWWRHRQRFGLALDDWHVNFTGKLVVPPAQDAPPYWRWNLPMRQGLVNMHHLTIDKVADVVRFLDRRLYAYYSGYPSVIHALAMAADEAGLSLTNPPRVVVTGAENMLGPQRRDIASLTGAVLTDQYGFSEGCGNASQCEEHVYHEDYEFGAIECVDPVPLGDGRVRGRIVCTGFASPEAPFIRYDTGDLGVWAADPEPCPCGRRSSILLGIDGRIDQYVLTPEGRRIMRFDYVFKETPNVQECQVVQNELGGIVLRVVRRAAYGVRDERLVAAEIARWVSPALEVEFEYVDEIARTSAGKFRAVVSRLDKSGSA